MIRELVQENLSAETYLLQEEKATVRHEFINGKLYEMPGGTRFHEEVVINLSTTLNLLRRNNGYKVFAQGLRCSPNKQQYYYPDVLVTNEVFTDNRFSQKPVLLSEVLSPSTRSFDTVDKFIGYRTIPSVEYSMLVEPDYCHVTLNYKTPEGEWMAEVFNKKTSVVDLPKLNIQVPLADIYFGLEWE
ncbi:MAG TPA: Uma2 family endonuclease [Segetibacter sp.]|jgi:Uma2 family endonuclease